MILLLLFVVVAISEYFSALRLDLGASGQLSLMHVRRDRRLQSHPHKFISFLIFRPVCPSSFDQEHAQARPHSDTSKQAKHRMTMEMDVWKPSELSGEQKSDLSS